MPYTHTNAEKNAPKSAVVRHEDATSTPERVWFTAPSLHGELAGQFLNGPYVGVTSPSGVFVVLDIGDIDVLCELLQALKKETAK